MNEKSHYVIIRFTSGSEKHVTALTREHAVNFMTRVNQTFERNYIMLEMDDKLEIIPTTSIESIQMAPKPDVELKHSTKVTEDLTDR